MNYAESSVNHGGVFVINRAPDGVAEGHGVRRCEPRSGEHFGRQSSQTPACVPWILHPAEELGAWLTAAAAGSRAARRRFERFELLAVGAWGGHDAWSSLALRLVAQRLRAELHA